MASTKIIKTFASAGNRKTWTWSGWVKRSALGSTYILMSTTNSGFPERFFFNSSDQLEYDHDIAGTDYTLQSNRVFRDTSGWYSIVVAKDTTQVTETDRLKIYVNGTEIPLTEVALGYPPEDYEGAINLDVENHIGVQDTSDYYFDGLMSHVHFVDGTAYPASTFGSTDATTGEWIINTSPTITYGTNGCFILKDRNSVTYQSG